METVATLDELRAACAQLARPLGFVPTMGFLHDGHLSLVRRAKEECASVVVSIFVNPTQFAPDEDLQAYPQDLPRDLGLLEAEGADLVWTPVPAIMYPDDFQTWVSVERVSRPLEGTARPGHFQGVTTVVAKLFNCVGPQKAYFGQKDAQQAVVIEQMVRDLNFPIEVVVCPTVREPDGLAMSSRNTYLNPQERQAAVVLYQALGAAREAFAAGQREADELRRIMAEAINTEPLARLEYVSCAHPETLEELETVTGRALLSMAVIVGKARLIDNVILGD